MSRKRFPLLRAGRRLIIVAGLAGLAYYLLEKDKKERMAKEQTQEPQHYYPEEVIDVEPKP